MNIIYLAPDEIIPYEKNPRNNEEAVEKVAESIKEFGFKVPIVLDENNVIVTGHTRYKASKLLGLKEVPCILADDLTPKQIKAFRLADNKVAEFSLWDFDLLESELLDLQEDFDLEAFGFNIDLESEPDLDEGEKERYTDEIKTPVYEVTGAKPKITELIKEEKTNELIKEINESNLTDEEKRFLKIASTRHYVFHFRNIAEFYAHANPEMQKLMEKSALVIIDYNDAIKYGYTVLNNELLSMMEEDRPEYEEE